MKSIRYYLGRANLPTDVTPTPILVWECFAGAISGSLGAVAGRVDALGRDGLEAAAGVGFRYRLNDQGVHIRLDYALGRAGAGLYITAQEPL